MAKGLHEAGATIGSAEEARKTRSDGFLYIIAHPRLHGVKIGRAFDPESRLNGYQTGCPNREYFLVYTSSYFEDCVTMEKRVHEALAEYRLNGEWFHVDAHYAEHIIDAQSPFKSIH